MSAELSSSDTGVKIGPNPLFSDEKRVAIFRQNRHIKSQGKNGQEPVFR